MSVLGALFGIAEDAVRLVDQAEAARVARFLIVWMKTLRKETEHAMNRLRFRVGADLKRLVVVLRFIVWHRAPVTWSTLCVGSDGAVV